MPPALPQAIVWQTDHSGLLHGGMFKQQAFHFHRIHVFATDLEHVLEAAEETEIAIGLALRHVAGG